MKINLHNSNIQKANLDVRPTRDEHPLCQMAFRLTQIKHLPNQMAVRPTQIAPNNIINRLLQ